MNDQEYVFLYWDPMMNYSHLIIVNVHTNINKDINLMLYFHISFFSINNNFKNLYFIKYYVGLIIYLNEQKHHYQLEDINLLIYTKIIFWYIFTIYIILKSTFLLWFLWHVQYYIKIHNLSLRHVIDKKIRKSTCLKLKFKSFF